MPNHQPSVEDLRVTLIVLKALSPAQKYLACKWTLIKVTECYHISYKIKQESLPHISKKLLPLQMQQT